MQNESSGESLDWRCVDFQVMVERRLTNDFSANKNVKVRAFTNVWTLGIVPIWALEEQHYSFCCDCAVTELLVMRHKIIFFIHLFFHSFVHLQIFIIPFLRFLMLSNYLLSEWNPWYYKILHKSLSDSPPDYRHLWGECWVEIYLTSGPIAPWPCTFRL